MHTVVETEVFVRRSAGLFTEQERLDLIASIAFHPHAGDEIPGTGGVRKLRVSAKGKGKRGGARVIYFLYDDTVPIFLITCYGKNERGDLNSRQRKSVAALAACIKSRARGRRPA